MENCNVEKFLEFLKEPTQNFKDIVISNNQTFYSCLFYYLDKIDEMVEYIKNDEIEEGYILNNLLFLQPLSTPFIEAYMKMISNSEISFEKRIEYVYRVSTSLLSNLKNQKMIIRKTSKTTKIFDGVEKDLEIILNDLQQYEEKLKLLKEKQQNQKKINELKSEISKYQQQLKVNKVEKLESILATYKKRKQEIDELKKEIEESKKQLRLLDDRAIQ